MKNNNTLKITWYGRCCFLVEYQGRRILFDAYDRYCNVEIGFIKADILVSSSSWHDHGHIGASPQAHVYTYPGQYENKGLRIIGLEAKEERSSPTVVFNLQAGPFSITNFADFGCGHKKEFYQSLRNSERQALKNTNIAFTRASLVGDPDGQHSHNECVLDFCSPALIFPEHYFPRNFTQNRVPKDRQESFLKPVKEIDDMITNLDYPVEEIKGFQKTILPKDLKSKKLVRFLKLPTQVTYEKRPDFTRNRFW
jgi:hypothetical protein